LVLELSSFELDDHVGVMASLLIALDPEAATSIAKQMKDTPATSKTCAIVLDHLLTNAPQSNAIELALAAEPAELVPKKFADYIQILHEKCGDAAADSARASLLHCILSGRLDTINIPACAHLARLLLRDKSNSALRYSANNHLTTYDMTNTSPRDDMLVCLFGFPDRSKSYFASPRLPVGMKTSSAWLRHLFGSQWELRATASHSAISS